MRRQLLIWGVATCCCVATAFGVLRFAPPERALVLKMGPFCRQFGVGSHLLDATEGRIGAEGQTYVWQLGTIETVTGEVGVVRALHTVPGTNAIQVVTTLRTEEWIKSQTTSTGPRTESTHYGSCYILQFPFLFEQAQRGWLDARVMYGPNADRSTVTQIVSAIEAVAKEFKPADPQH